MKKKLSIREYDRKVQEILSRMKEHATPFEDMSEAAKQARKERARRDHFFFFRTYLPHYFIKPSAEFHAEIVSFLDTRGIPVAIAAPREHAKSTIVSLGYPLHQMLFEIRHFIILVSDTLVQASLNTSFLKLELEENERIRADFGDLRNAVDWSDEKFTTRTGIMVLARGRGQKIRGLRNRQYRPDLVVLDDIENDKSVRNPRIVKETVNWILEAVYPSIAGAGQEGTLLIVGTLLSRKSVLGKLMENERFISRKYRALDDNNNSLWPERHSKVSLLKTKALIGSVRFAKEYQNDPRDEEGLFREEWIVYYHRTEITEKALYKVSYTDPSVEEGASNDFKAIVTVGYDPDTGIFYVLDAFIRHCSIDQMLRVNYNRYDEFRPFIAGLETNVFQKLLVREYDRLAIKKGYHLPIKQVEQKVAKESRIARLSPLVERGLVRFQKEQGDQNILIEQLIYFPSSTVHDDGPDALEGAVNLCETACRKFEYRGVRRSHLILHEEEGTMRPTHGLTTRGAY